MRLEQMKNKNYLRQKINYNNSTEVMEGVTSTPEMFDYKIAFPFLFQNKYNLHVTPNIVNLINFNPPKVKCTCVQVEAKLQEITRLMIIVDLSLLRSADSQMRPWLLHVPSW